MIAIDTNILVAFHRTEYSTHKKAISQISDLAEGYDSWAIPWPCIHEFIAIVTNSRIFEKPTLLPQAVKVLEQLMESPSLRLLGEGPDYWEGFRSLIIKGSIQGPRVHDARIAAICLENGVRCLWTADRDFNRFPALKCINPCV